MVASDPQMRPRLHMWDGGNKGADHTLPPMTGGDRWSRPKAIVSVLRSHTLRPGRERNFVPRTHRRDRYDQCGGIRQKGSLFPLRTRVWAGTSPSPLKPTNDGKGMRSSYSSDDGTGNRLSIGSVGTTSARGIYKKGNIFPLRTTVWPGPPRPRETPPMIMWRE